MGLHGTSKVNSQGVLEIGNCNIIDLANEYGTPLWIFDEELIRNTCREFVKCFTKRGKSQILYASKAFLTTAMCKIIEQEGLGLDVVSGGELYTAIEAGFPVDKIFFHGNNKSIEELEFAVDLNIGRIVVDNFQELYLLNKIVSKKRVVQPILLRITPGVEAHTHDYIKTGQIDSKFGFTLTNGQALEAIKKVANMKRLELKGIHCHIGSQIFTMDSYSFAAKVMTDFIKEIYNITGHYLEELNLGGGLGIYYSSGDEPSTIDNYAETIMETVKNKCRDINIPIPKVIIEPGRSIIGPAGTTLYKVGNIKDIPGVRKYVSVDGGMFENLRPALYEAKYEVYVANKMNDPALQKVTITGKCCESGDILAWNVKVPEIDIGDLIVMPCTGAYGYSMASNYNRMPKQAAVLVYRGQSDIIIKRETYKDLIRNDIIPERFQK